MNLALILHALSGNNGISRAVLSMAREFSKLGHTTHIYASRLLLSEKAKSNLPGGIFLHRYPCLRGSNRIWTAPFGAILPLLKKEHDLVISHMLTIWQDVIVMHNDPQPVEVEKMSAVPFTVVRPRLRTKNRFLRTFIERKRFDPRRYKNVVAFSRGSAAGITAAYGVSADRMTVIRHGVDASYFSPDERAARRANSRAELGLSPEHLVFVYVGDSWKGLEFAIKGLAASRAAKRCVLIASGPFHPGPFSALAEAFGLRLICNDDWRDIRDFYGAGDVFISPTPMDTFGLAALEAMSMGLAVITTVCAGLSEFLENGENACILDRPWDTAAIADMADRLADSGFRERIASRGAALAAGLSWEQPALDHLAVYQKTRRA